MLFQRAKSVETDIDSFMDNILKAALTFNEAVRDYYTDHRDEFSRRVKDIRALESRCDHLKHDIKHVLYTELLIPNARGDVLGLLETLDDVIDDMEKVMVRYDLEQPVRWPGLSDDFISLADAASKSVTELIAASRFFFRETSKVPDTLVKVLFWEHEADKLEEKIIEKAFRGNFIEKFSEKVHVRYFAELISSIADSAEAVADRLDIYSIKRTV